MTMIQLLAWSIYLVAAVLLYRLFLRHHADAWFPRRWRIARILFLVLLLSPTVSSAEEGLMLTPATMSFVFQGLMQSPLGMLKVALSWFLFGSLWLWLDAVWQRLQTDVSH